ncbi:MAG: VanZ family protein [Melioribacteraceae bacterium]|nr:VanZ family protein [Melioribacteraceae bacterium]
MFKIIDNHPKYFFYIPLVLYWILLLVLTSLPSNALPKQAFSDKVNHFLAYFGLAVLLSGTLFYQKKNRFLSAKYLISTIVLSSFYGFLDELHQLFIPGRYAEFYDWVANFIGALTGTFIFFLFLKIREKKNSIEQ